ncbi:LysR family transcriptional regulator [Microbacterium sp.]|uniref:LysR family transcriptional regulator n=1 Tax=Microbacterium sp. TaxID=51671 RepID=UPI003241E455
MELSQVRAFVAVSRLGTISAAAEELHVTPSPLSRTIRELERRLDGELFQRTYHQLERTPLGERFLPLAVEIIAQADEAEALSAAGSVPFRVGGTPWTSRVLNQRLAEVSEEVAGGALGYASELSSSLLRALRHGQLDLALVHLPTDALGISSLPLAQYGYVVAVADGDTSLDLGRPLHLTDLAGRRMLTLPLMMQPTAMNAFVDTIHAAGVEAVEEIDLREIVGLRGRMARTGEVMLITHSDELPAAAFFDLNTAATYPLASGEISLQVGLAWRSRDMLHRDLIERIAAKLSPPAGELPYIR